ncbi:hypothetical protein ACFXKF_32295 [Streptomyces scopuliridis]|uniref:hypothetical protein n=1 Tax=Streptomyces scopuliridis TaxID=452529 RepID=UPI003673BEA8
MKTSSSRIALTGATTATAALLLTACSGSGSIEHGIVKDKRGHGGYTSTNCRNVTSNAFTQSLSLTGGSSGGRSSSSGSGSRSGSSGSKSSSSSGSSGNNRPAAPKNLQKDTGNHGTGTSKNKQKDTGKTSSRRVCDYVDARWELKLQDGKRTGWKRVSKNVWDDVNKGDHI